SRNQKSWLSDQGSRWRDSNRPRSSRALALRLKVSKFNRERANGFRAMADRVLHFGWQFTEGFFESVGHEDRIVAKSAVAARFICDSSFHNSFKGSKKIAVARERHNASKLGSTRILCGANSRVCLQKFVDVFVVSRIFGRVARGVNSWRS